MKISRILISAFVTSFGAHPLVAQVTDDQVEATAVALPAVMTKLPPGPSVIVHNDRTLALAQRLGAKLGKTISHESSRLLCRDETKAGPKTCSVQDGISLVNIAGIKLKGENAKVYFGLEIASGSARQPVEAALYEICLVRSGGKWTVTGIELVAIS